MTTMELVTKNQDMVTKIMDEYGVHRNISDEASLKEIQKIIPKIQKEFEKELKEIEPLHGKDNVNGPIVCTAPCAATCVALCAVTAVIGAAPAAVAGETAALAGECTAVCALSALVGTGIAAAFI